MLAPRLRAEEEALFCCEDDWSPLELALLPGEVGALWLVVDFEPPPPTFPVESALIIEGGTLSPNIHINKIVNVLLVFRCFIGP
jgi:hypothetical protein